MMNKVACWICVVVALTMLSTATFAQKASKINLQLRSYIAHSANLDQQTQLMVKGDAQQIAAYTKGHQGIFKYDAVGFSAISLPVREIETFSQQLFVEYIEFSLVKGLALNDQMRINNNIDSIHMGAGPLNGVYVGKDVILGVIDTGLEILHPDFWLDTVGVDSGRTRILTVWDQNVTTGGQIPSYGYGTVWDSTQINAGICTHEDTSGHGSTVTGSACANGLAGWGFAGVATEADIVVVEIDFEAVNWLATIADAVDYIFAIADSVGKPAVINASVGTYLGAHDGKDAAAMLIDNLILQKRGRAMVAAAGNSGTVPYHLGYDVNSDTSFTWFSERSASGSLLGYDAVYFQVWSDTADLNNVQYAVGADKTAGGYSFRGATSFYDVSAHLNTVVTDSIMNNGHVIGYVDYYAELLGDRYSLEILMAQPDSSQYKFRFMTTGSGHVDVWSDDWLGTSHMTNTGLPSVATFPAIAYYVLPNDESTIVDSWNCSENVISVANYINRISYVDYNGVTQNGPGTVGELHFSSSAGPTRDDRVKPDVGATGNIAMSANAFGPLAFAIANTPFKVAEGGMHMRNGGTSMASPVVAGIVACYLSKCPTATMVEIKEAVQMTATEDGFTGTVPNMLWGQGKVNGFQALLYTQFEPAIVALSDTMFCEGDSVEIAGPAGYLNYLWSTGDTTETIYVAITAAVQVQVWDSAGCHGTSRWMSTLMYLNPTAPAVTNDLDTVFSTASTSYQWYLDNNAISGATNQTHIVLSTGFYSVQVTDANGCTATSDSVFVAPSAIETYETSNFSVYPNPNAGKFNMAFGNVDLNNVRIQIVNVVGAVIDERFYEAITSGSVLPIELPEQTSGVFFITVYHPELRIHRKIIIE